MFFTDDIENDKVLMDVLKSLVYSWKVFGPLRKEYEEGKRHLVYWIEKFAKCVNDTVEMEGSVNKNMSSMAISQSYLKKPELITKVITLAVQLVMKTSDFTLINTCTQPINQEKEIFLIIERTCTIVL